MRIPNPSHTHLHITRNHSVIEVDLVQYSKRFNLHATLFSPHTIWCALSWLVLLLAHLKDFIRFIVFFSFHIFNAQSSPSSIKAAFVCSFGWVA